MCLLMLPPCLTFAVNSISFDRISFDIWLAWHPQQWKGIYNQPLSHQPFLWESFHGEKKTKSWEAMALWESCLLHFSCLGVNVCVGEKAFWQVMKRKEPPANLARSWAFLRVESLQLLNLAWINCLNKFITSVFIGIVFFSKYLN